MNILDCTLRDGGYYNQWDFSDSLVTKYVKAMNEAKVDWVEIGFRNDVAGGFAGRYHYCRDEWLLQITAGRQFRLAVMIDGKNFIALDDPEPALRRVFSLADESPVDMVRITATLDTVSATGKLVPVLKDLGYLVSFNLMRGSLTPDDAYRDSIDALQRSEADFVYVADSFGGMLPEETARKIGILAENLSARIGFHAHDNLGLALANSLAALGAGAHIVDSSVSGMGRGAGNLRTEQLLLVVDRYGSRRFDTLFDLVSSDFADLQREFGWGASLPYVLSGVHGVHPMYAQHLLEVPRYTPLEVLDMLSRVGQSGKGSSYSPQVLSEAREANRADLGDGAVEVSALPTFVAGSPVDCDQNGASTVVVVGSGPSGRTRAGDVDMLVRHTGARVLECNASPDIPVCGDHVSVFVNHQRLRQARTCLGMRPSAVLGMPRVWDEDAGSLRSVKVWRWPYRVASGKLEIEADGCVLPADVVGMYAVALALRMGAERIYLVGFDGYFTQQTSQGSFHAEQIRAQHEMEEFFSLLQAHESVTSGRVEVKSLVPTAYPVPVQSVYEFV